MFLLHIICCSGPLTYHSEEFAIRNGEFYNSIIKKTCHIECIIGTKSHSLWTIKITLITKGTYKPAKRNNEQKKTFQMKLLYFVDMSIGAFLEERFEEESTHDVPNM